MNLTKRLLRQRKLRNPRKRFKKRRMTKKVDLDRKKAITDLIDEAL